MRVAGRLAAEVLEMIEPHVLPGVTTEELDRRCHDYIVEEQQAIPAPLNYRGFPRSICTSVNHQVCHGIPSDKQLKKGDILNIDITVIKDGYHGDTSKMFCLGEASILARRLVKVTHEALWIGLDQVHPGRPWATSAMPSRVTSRATASPWCEEYCGHGIGRDFHEEPQILHYGKRGTGLVLRAGMCFTIEPMVNAGKRSSSCCPTAGRSSPRIAASRPSGNTRSWSPPMATRS